jgi:hypothetical protein
VTGFDGNLFFDVLDKTSRFRAFCQSVLQTSHYPSAFQATGTTEKTGTTGTALPLLNDLNGAQRLNGLNDLNNPICVETFERMNH